MASSSSTSLNQWTYNVFVSFRGEDIRKSFIDHLFSDFTRKGIHVFRDNKQLKRGEDISLELYKAIENSRFLLVIFSKNYATSTWCLRELVKILECSKTGKNYEVWPIFYDVKPSVVRDQTESYGEAFIEHVTSNIMEVQIWKEALRYAANLSGWELQDMTNGYEAKFVGMISKGIICKLCNGPLDVGENLVGLDSRVEKMNFLQFVGSRKVHMIGICGIGGIGKTTVAKAIFNLLYIHFDGSFYCEDVKGATTQAHLVHLQKQLMANVTNIEDLKITSVGEGIRVLKQRMGSKRVLIVLDDVHKRSQLEALVGNRNWFGHGSMVVLTGRDKQLLKVHRVDPIYEIGPLCYEEARELFSLYAFREKCPNEDFRKLTDRVVGYAQGLPLALQVLGCYLYEKTVGEWENELDKLQSAPNAEIQQVLELSYDGLDNCYFYEKTVSEWEIELDKLQSAPDAEIQQVLKLSYDGLDNCYIYEKTVSERESELDKLQSATYAEIQQVLKLSYDGLDNYYLYENTVGEWETELDKLQSAPDAEIQQVLKLSYDGLDSCYIYGKTLSAPNAEIQQVLKLNHDGLDNCSLYEKTVSEWELELDKLQSAPNAEIQQVLKLNHDGLDNCSLYEKTVSEWELELDKLQSAPNAEIQQVLKLNHDELGSCYIYEKTVSEWELELDKLQSAPNAEIQQVLKLYHDGLDNCYLYEKTVSEWEIELDKLQSAPDAEIQQVLKLSYDGLDHSQRNTFLDIECFFKGEEKYFVKNILDGCNFFSDADIRALVDKNFAQ